MRRFLFVTLALVLLLSIVGTASAQTVGDYDETVLGDVWIYPYGGFLPFERVDVYLWQPSTLLGWPVGFPAPVGGTWWMPIGESEVRRQSYPAYQAADEYGYYYAEFMFPRDEAWYPCSFPYKWNCNVLANANPIVFNFHSPVDQTNFEFGLLWPYYDSQYLALNPADFAGAWALANPMDTIAPLWAIIEGEFSGDLYYEPYEVQGYYWKWTDLEDDFEYIGLP